MCVSLRLVEVSADNPIGIDPAVVVSEEMPSIQRFPRTHADVSAQYGIIDVFPFRTVTVPLNVGLAVWVGHKPRSDDALMRPDVPVIQNQRDRLLRSDSWVRTGCVRRQSEKR